MEKKKIVIVDDEQDLMKLIRMNLVISGKFDPITLEDPFLVEQICVDQKVDLVLIDYIMPKRIGADIIVGLRSRPETKEIPVIIMSGLGETFKDRVRQLVEEDPSRAEHINDYQGFIEKPFRIEDLVDKIEHVLTGKGI